MVVMWSKNKYPGEAVVCLNLDELSECYNKTENIYDEWGDKKWHRVKLYTKSKMLKFFKAIKGFECDKTKAEIIEGIWNKDLKRVWEEYYEEE